MTARGYEQDTALLALKDRIRRLELAVARNKPAGGVDYNDDGGLFGGGTLTIADVLALIGAGTQPQAFYLRRYGGGSDTETLTAAASVTADLANASVFLTTLDQDVTFTVVGFLPAGRRSEFAFAVTQDGTGGHTPTFTGFTWIGGTPTWDTTPGTVTDVIGFSDDGGTNIRAAVLGGSSASTPIEVFDEGVSLTAALASLDFVGAGVTATTVGDAVTVTIPGGGGSGDASGQFIVGFDAGIFLLVAGKQQDIIAPFTGTITDWTLLSDTTGSAVVDIWNDIYTNYPPAVADSITAAAKPTLSGGTKATSSTLTGWTTAVTAGDILRFNLDSVSGLHRLLLVVAYSRP